MLNTDCIYIYIYIYTYFIEFQPMTSASNDYALYTKTSIDFWYRQRLNLRYLIQLIQLLEEVIAT